MAGRRRGERGQSMVEFAIVAQIFLLLSFLVYQGGVAWFDKLTVEEAARDAARKASVNRELTPSQIVAAAQAEARSTASSLDQSQLRVDVTPLDNPDAADGVLWEQGDLVRVTVSYPFSVGVFGVNMSGTLTSTTTMRME
jgi:Flp pilus assembly protein TadG